MTFCLDTITIKPENNFEIKNAIILLHGYGGDGKDISVLSLNWKRHLPNTIFICPNGHERCHINPSGYQWFDLTKENNNYILEQSLIAERKLNQFIPHSLNDFTISIILHFKFKFPRLLFKFFLVSSLRIPQPSCLKLPQMYRHQHLITYWVPMLGQQREKTLIQS